MSTGGASLEWGGSHEPSEILNLEPIIYYFMIVNPLKNNTWTLIAPV